MARVTSKAVAVQSVNLIGAYVSALFDLETSKAAANDQAVTILKACTTVDAVDKVGKEFKAEYLRQYAERKGIALKTGEAFDAARKVDGSPEFKAYNASNMAWSRMVTVAKDAGWVRPVAENDKAAKARTTRAAASAGKVDGRTTKTGSRASNKVAGVIVPETEDDELAQAFDWVMEDESRQTLFIAWVAAHQGATRTVRRVKAA